MLKTNYKPINKLTSGVEVVTKNIEVDNDNICTLSIWDISGHERFTFIRSTFYKGAAGALLVFDLSRAATWDEIKNWRAEVKQSAGDIPFVLIGNKKELLAEVGEVIDSKEAHEYAESQGGTYIETNSTNSISFNEALRLLTNKIIGGNIPKSKEVEFMELLDARLEILIPEARKILKMSERKFLKFIHQMRNMNPAIQLTVHKIRLEGNWNCGKCGKLNPETRMKCVKCGFANRHV